MRARASGPAARRAWAWARLLGGLSILALLVWQVGTGPFLDGVRGIDRSALAAAFGISMLTTVCCAWRWSLVAGVLGVRLPLGRAVAAYYRAQFLNTTLPGGVAGDVHRAVRHGLDISDVRLAVHAVVAERSIGLAVQVTATLVLLAVFPSPVRPYLPPVLAVLVALALGVWLATRALTRTRPAADPARLGGRLRDRLHAAVAGLRAAPFTRRAWAGIVAASALGVVGHLVLFLLAARTAGATAPLTLLVPLTQLALLAMALPVSFAGWGPREGVAAWAFGAAGMTATQGVTTAVTYGVLVLVAALPGAAVLLARTLRPRVALRGGADV
ncbi:lysylphosphatidylglycerol synthase transmembrane domain-containing protein [Catellatospora sp. NPDC049609]|uniref:lysylphosphatidylglycerol synthase transmembrane domain-containing protein n=1 Tax=Catellatospora sp. NPDC049609 TaxID=3155505 RepID=UPI0034459011